MKNMMRATLLAFLLLSGGSQGWSQIQLTDAKPSTLPAAKTGSLDVQFPDGFVPQSVVQASYCDSCGMAGTDCACEMDSGGSGMLGSSLLGGGLLSGGLGAGSGMGLSGGWLEAEYLLWWTKDRYMPALATQSPGTTATAVAGQLGQPTTSVLFGNEEIDSSPHSGVRISLGAWVDQAQSIGFGSRFFYIAGEEDFGASSPGDPFLGRPFFDTVNNTQAALLLAEPNVASGSINITAKNEAGGSDIFLRKLLLSGYCNRLDLIGGYSRSYVEDSVEIHDSFTVTGATPRAAIGSVLSNRDYFEVRNEFHGGFIGFMAESADGPLSWSTFAKIAIGSMNQEARVTGSSTTTVPGAGSATNPFGLLALPSNIGRFDQDEFAIIPELNVSVRYNVSQNFQVMMGYSFIYWSEVALAGDLIDLNVNTTQINGNLVGAGAPTLPELKSDGFWYTGVSFGGVFRF